MNLDSRSIPLQKCIDLKTTFIVNLIIKSKKIKRDLTFLFLSLINTQEMMLNSLTHQSKFHLKRNKENEPKIHMNPNVRTINQKNKSNVYYCLLL